MREQLEDQKVLEFTREKDRRESEKEATASAKKAEREIELARLRAAQERVSDKAAQQDALRARRAYESFERDWRRKELDCTEQAAQQQAELRQDRHTHQRAREHAVAAEAQKLKAEFFETLRRQKVEEQRFKAAEKEHVLKNKSYALQLQVPSSTLFVTNLLSRKFPRRRPSPGAPAKTICRRTSS